MNNHAHPQTSTKTPHPHSGFQQRRQQRRQRLWILTGISLLAGSLYLFYTMQYAGQTVMTNDAYISGNLIPLKAQTGGTVIEVGVDDTQYVQQGQVLVRLDGLQAEVALAQASANLADSVRQIEVLFKQTEMLHQKAAAKDLLLQRSRLDLARYRRVVAEGGVSAQQIEDSEFLVREQEAELKQIQAELGSSEALVAHTDAADNPKVLQAVAAFKQAYLDWYRQQIVAPVSGYVAKRSIQAGEQVRPETALLSIVPLDYLWVEANFLEDELHQVQPGQPVAVSVDLYGSTVVYHGEVQGLAAGTGSVFGLLPPNNATGNYIHIVERVPVRISLPAAELAAHPLRPGLSAKVSIDTSRPGHPVLQPLTTVPETGYKTDVYSRQLA